ncbi:hypothetical protein [Nonomuraea sp. NPDC049309]|uniref:hypothetical protein n=1 Tax=Nonomuraea sp. NPDC049309 TaxID=3364350 RepID=UPI0037185D31
MVEVAAAEGHFGADEDGVGGAEGQAVVEGFGLGPVAEAEVGAGDPVQAAAFVLVAVDAQVAEEGGQGTAAVEAAGGQAAVHQRDPGRDSFAGVEVAEVVGGFQLGGELLALAVVPGQDLVGFADLVRADALQGATRRCRWPSTPDR